MLNSLLNINLGTAVIIILVSMWIIQLILTYFQMKRFNIRVKTIRKDGITSIGMEGSFLKGRIYTVLVIDENDVIVHAEKLSGMTVFSNLNPVPSIVGHSIHDIVNTAIDLPLKKKERKSFVIAVNNILNKRVDVGNQ